MRLLSEIRSLATRIGRLLFTVIFRCAVTDSTGTPSTRSGSPSDAADATRTTSLNRTAGASRQRAHVVPPPRSRSTRTLKLDGHVPILALDQVRSQHHDGFSYTTDFELIKDGSTGGAAVEQELGLEASFTGRRGPAVEDAMAEERPENLRRASRTRSGNSTSSKPGAGKRTGAGRPNWAGSGQKEKSAIRARTSASPIVRAAACS